MAKQPKGMLEYAKELAGTMGKTVPVYQSHAHKANDMPITAGSKMTIFIDGKQVDGMVVTEVVYHQDFAGPTYVTVKATFPSDYWITQQTAATSGNGYFYTDGFTFNHSFDVTAFGDNKKKFLQLKGGQTKAPKQLPDLSTITAGLKALQ